MSRVQLLLDENVPSAVEIALHRRAPGTDVCRVGLRDAPSKGSSDTDLLAWCEEGGLILVTLDRRTMPDHLAAHLASGNHSPGVLLVRPGALLSQVVDDLLLIVGAS